jgi:peroxiredoxin
MKMKKRVLRTGLYAILLIAALVLLVPAVSVGAKEPRFSLAAVGQSAPIVLSDYRGQVVLVNFWATWCPPCRLEIPALIKLQAELGPRGFTVIGLSMDEGGTKSVARFAEKMGINYPLAMADGNVVKEFGGVIGIPASFLIDRDGALVKSYPGFVTHEVLEKDIGSLMNAR